MSTNPDFVPQDESNFTPIRYYTAFDPYFYTVDNRPLQDIETNLMADRGVGSDSARRAALLGSMNLAAVLADIYKPNVNSSAVRTAAGLEVSLSSSNHITVGTGAIYELRAVSEGVTDVIMKQAFCSKPTNFVIANPFVGGTSVVYTIEAKFVELTATNLATTELPNLDEDNALLPSTLIHGELKLVLVTGVAASTGSEVPPATTSGNIPLYNITSTNGVTDPTIWAHANSPYRKGIDTVVTPVPLSSGGAVSAIQNEINVMNFVNGSTIGVILPLNVNVKTLNPLLPIKMKLTLSSSASTGSIAFRARYKGYIAGGAYTDVGTNTSADAIAYSGSANGIQTLTTSIAIVPNTAFAGFVDNIWTINVERLSIVLERLGSHASDTNTGTVSIAEIVLFQ